MTDDQCKLRKPRFRQFTGDPDRDRIINLRRELRLSQLQLARALNCSKATVSSIENGYKPIGTKAINKALLPRIEKLEQQHGITPPPSVKEELPLNKRILKVRKILDLSQKDLAILLGVSVVSIGRWENKATLTIRKPHSDLLKKLEAKISLKKTLDLPNAGEKRNLRLVKKAADAGCDPRQRTLFDDDTE